MKTVRRRAHARAALAGNPSDGYGGKTIAVAIRDFFAEVTLEEAEAIAIVRSAEDDRTFASPEELAADVRRRGYYGTDRLIRATVKRFADYARAKAISLDRKPFRASATTTIPRQVGLAGSSAIIVATLDALAEYYGMAIPLEVRPSLALAVEKEELGIPAGLQDRVIQVYGGLVFMDFSIDGAHTIDGYRCHRYERLDPGLLPNLYLAWHDRLSEPTEVFHQDIRARFDRGDLPVVNVMRRLADVADRCRAAILAKDTAALGRAMNENFDLRRSIYRLPDWQIAQVEAARSAGATANFAGSGGAIIGTFEDDRMFERLARALDAVGSRTIRPAIG